MRATHEQLSIRSSHDKTGRSCDYVQARKYLFPRFPQQLRAEDDDYDAEADG